MIKFIIKSIHYIKVKIIKYLILKFKIERKKKFNLIYKTNYWSSNVSRSGTGSTLENTKNIRRGLSRLINKYNIKEFLDIPCGDFYWMKTFLSENPNLIYIGGDIVGSLIENLNNKNNSGNISFIEIDLVKDKLPSSDLLFCRDCFMHFSNEDIIKSLKNFLNSNIKYIAISNFVKTNIVNENIDTGEYREVNLFLPPFNLTENNLLNLDDINIEESKKKQDARKISVWSKDQIYKSINEKKNE